MFSKSEIISESIKVHQPPFNLGVSVRRYWFPVSMCQRVLDHRYEAGSDYPSFEWLWCEVVSNDKTSVAFHYLAECLSLIGWRSLLMCQITLYIIQNGWLLITVTDHMLYPLTCMLVPYMNISWWIQKNINTAGGWWCNRFKAPMQNVFWPS